MIKQKKLWYLLTIMLVAMLSIGLSSCGDDDDKGGSNSDLIGYWVKEAHLNNPERNGSGGTVISYGYQFLSNGTVYVFQLQHTGLGSRYSYAEANTSWVRLTTRNGVSFYINPDKKVKTYTRAGNEVYIDISSDESSNPTIMAMTSTDCMEAVSLDGWAEGKYVRIKDVGGNDGSINNGDGNNNNGNDSGGDGSIDAELFVIEDSQILMGVDYWQDGIYLYKLQMGFGANNNDAYNKGITEMRATVWANKGSIGSYSSSSIGKKETYTLYLSPTNREFYDWITVYAKSKEITFNYKLEYYNSNNGQWNDIQSRNLTFNATGGNDDQGGGSLTGSVQGHDYVDLGLSVKWATCNVGASNLEDKGGYFQWGEITTSYLPDYYGSLQCMQDYEFYDKTADSYDNIYKYIGSNISGTKYDAAYKKWGNKWRMATAEEWKELINNCSWKYTTLNGVEGFTGTGKNGQIIFLPAAGRMEGNWSSEGGYYWSASIDPDDSINAQYVVFHDNSYRPQLKEWDRVAAMSIRAVTK